MLPRLTQLQPLQHAFSAYLDALAASAFSGDIHRDAATRLVTATDNSVYQLLPQAVVFPRSAADVEVALTLATRPEFASVTFTPRGGGTGTNGQSLTDGVVIDVSRHMNQILAVDLDAGVVRVQPGVVLDQLNDALAPHGVFFAPNLSPSSRATIGGMIATDACGKGSRIYGKTSEHLRAVEMVFIDGTRFTSTPVDATGLNALCARDDVVGRLHRTIHSGVVQHRDTIASQWPKLRRFMTGYNLARVADLETGDFNLPMLIAGSEGSLGVVTEATLQLTPIPAHRALVVLKFASFEDALASAGEVVAADPGAIETIDERVLALAREDIIYHQVKAYLTETPHGPTRAINLVEFEGGDLGDVQAKVDALVAAISASSGQPGRAIGHHIAPNAAARAALWTLRKKGVGLLGNTPGARKPIAFIEDTVVPPEHLPAYVSELRQILDGEGVVYGMFGHVDVGCLHVRPALDMQDPEDAQRLRRISDQVARLVQRYGGLIWGEHGKGMRAEYSPAFFGETLFGLCCEIKGAADPSNRLSPGKVATPPDARAALVTIDAPTRGERDRQIPAVVQRAFRVAIDCNGNGACFDYAPDHVMCPSSKITRDRVHSPKGRAGVMREWLRQLATAGYDPVKTLPWGRLKAAATWPVRAFHTVARRFGRYDYSTEVYDAMAGCLACKACATQCPVKVDVPSFRSRFIELYHRRYLRPPKDGFVGALEGVLPWMARLPRATNWLLRRKPVRWILGRGVGIVDTPEVAARTLAVGLRERGTAPVSVLALARRPDTDPTRTVVLLQDAFTSFYEPQVVLAAYDVIQALGYTPVVASYFPNGKGLHVKGLLHRFARRVRKNTRIIEAYRQLGVTLVAVDPAVGLTYRDEYPEVLGRPLAARVHLLQEWLDGALVDAPTATTERSPGFRLLGHCTEITAEPTSSATWQRVFARVGLGLEPVSAGCCGMSGAYGHEAAHRAESEGIFNLSWARHLVNRDVRYLATGFSCRSQAKRFGSQVPRHPVEVLAEQLTKPHAEDGPLALPAPAEAPS